MHTLKPLHIDIPDDILLALADIEHEYDAAELNSLERKEYETFTNGKRKREFLATRLLMKDLGNSAGIDPVNFTVQKDKMGKPYGRVEGSPVYLTIAHSNEQILCGLSLQREVGADVEPVDRKVSERLKNRIMHSDEKEELSELNTVRLWTIKEALVKLMGGGLRTNLNEVCVRPLPGHRFIGTIDNDKSAIICNFEYNNHWISVAYYR